MMMSKTRSSLLKACSRPRDLPLASSLAAHGSHSPCSHSHSNSNDVMSDDVQLQLLPLPDKSLELVVRGARSNRLFFEPQPGDTSSILGLTDTVSPFKESVVVAVESENPYADFRRSMEEMVESHRDWGSFCLEDLLRWYLRMNGTENHGFIVQAFVDLLFNLSR